MTSYKLSQLTATFQEKTDGNSKTIEVLTRFSVCVNILDQIKVSSVSLAIQNINRSEDVAAYVKTLRQLSNEILGGINLAEFFREFHDLQQFLSAFAANFTQDTTRIGFEELSAKIQKFLDAFDLFVKQKDLFSFVKLVELSDSVLTTIKNLQDRFYFFRDELLHESDQVEQQDCEYLELYFESDFDLDTLLLKLKALKIIYEELCMLLEVSTSQYPLRVVNLELGSIWLKIFGESKVIGLITECLKESTSYIYRNLTNEGKRGQTSTIVNELKDQLDLRNKMKASGLDTTSMDAELEKAGQLSAQGYVRLLSDLTSIEINGSEYRFTHDNPRTLFPNTREPLQLEAENQTEPE